MDTRHAARATRLAGGQRARVLRRLVDDGRPVGTGPHGTTTSSLRDAPDTLPDAANTAWQHARKEAGLGDLHVHDLRHTVGMRLREAGVQEGTIADLLWHSTTTMTRHYSVAQIVELHAALEKVKEDSGRWNKSLQTLRREQEGQRAEATPPKVPQ